MLKHHVLIDEAAIAARVAELARRVAADLPSRAPVVVGLLVGSAVFAADLIRALARIGVEPQLDFLGVSHYGAAIEPGGAVTLRHDIAVPVHARPVLLVDDIIDTGWSLRFARDHLAAREPSWLRTCVLCDKPARRVADIHPDYVGFEVPDRWLIGYGLDAGGLGRGLPYIGVLDEAPG